VTKHKFIVAIEAEGLSGMTQSEIAQAVAFSLGILNTEDDEDFEVEVENVTVWPLEMDA
jgi:formaldehyde-activating enzyme involved in methanogenesis